MKITSRKHRSPNTQGRPDETHLALTPANMLTMAMVSFAIMVGVALVGERTLFLFGGDEALAGRLYATFYASLMGFFGAGLGGAAVAQCSRVLNKLGQSREFGRDIFTKVAKWTANSVPYVFLFFFLGGHVFAGIIWFTEEFGVPLHENTHDNT